MTQSTDKKKSKFKPSPQEAHVFNRDVVRQHRERAANNFSKHAFLVQEISSHLLDSLKDIKRSYDHILNMNVAINQNDPAFKNNLVINQDLSAAMISGKPGLSVQADEEFFPFKNNSFDLVLSCLNLHWVNDLPGSLSQIHQCLKPDGLFLAAMFGGETLHELRSAMINAETNIRGGVSPHISPFVDVRDAGSLMQRAEFALPVINTERITVTYSDAFALMKELKAMGENNALIARYKGLSSKQMMIETAKIYHDQFADDKGRIPATFDIIYLQGWSPHESQQKPLKPGSGQMSLKDALGAFPPKHEEKS